MRDAEEKTQVHVAIPNEYAKCPQKQHFLYIKLTTDPRPTKVLLSKHIFINLKSIIDFISGTLDWSKEPPLPLPVSLLSETEKSQVKSPKSSFLYDLIWNIFKCVRENQVGLFL